MDTVGSAVDWNGVIGSAANDLFASLSSNHLVGTLICVGVVIDRDLSEVRLTIHRQNGGLLGSVTVPGAIPDTLTGGDLNVLSGVPGAFKSFAWKKGPQAGLIQRDMAQVAKFLIGTR